MRAEIAVAADDRDPQCSTDLFHVCCA
jgi:hypothetical protein